MKVKIATSVSGLGDHCIPFIWIFNGFQKGNTSFNTHKTDKQGLNSVLEAHTHPDSNSHITSPT